jgi:hypothetical protein
MPGSEPRRIDVGSFPGRALIGSGVTEATASRKKRRLAAIARSFLAIGIPNPGGCRFRLQGGYLTRALERETCWVGGQTSLVRHQTR